MKNERISYLQMIKNKDIFRHRSRAMPYFTATDNSGETEKMIGSAINLNNSNASFGDEVYMALCRDIANGFFLPGDKLGIEAIAKMKEVSHMPVREALQRMGRDGLVEVRHNRGFYVRKITPGEVREIWAIRVELESLAIRWMMEKKVSPKLIKSLEKNCEDYRRSERIRDLYLLDMEFHSAIIKNSGSVQLHDILEKRLILLNSFYLTTAVVVIPTIKSIERSYQEHAAILQAIRKNELNTAVKCLRFHLENAGEELLKNMKKRDRKLS